jgi:hypothetical protein
VGARAGRRALGGQAGSCRRAGEQLQAGRQAGGWPAPGNARAPTSGSYCTRCSVASRIHFACSRPVQVPLCFVSLHTELHISALLLGSHHANAHQGRGQHVCQLHNVNLPVAYKCFMQTCAAAYAAIGAEATMETRLHSCSRCTPALSPGLLAPGSSQRQGLNSWPCHCR